MGCSCSKDNDKKKAVDPTKKPIDNRSAKYLENTPEKDRKSEETEKQEPKTASPKVQNKLSHIN